MQYDNTNRGVLFRNDRKVNEKYPDETGTINMVCVHCGAQNDLKIASWNKKSKNGKDYKSLSISAPKDEFDQRPDAEVEESAHVDEPINVNDIPF